MDVRIYTDGGARGNPGPAGAGAVLFELKDGKERRILAEISEYLGETTNNQAEYTAIIRGLQKAIELHADEVEVVMDSELAVRQLTGVYRVKNPGLAQRFLEIQALMPRLKRVRFRHVRREFNKKADALVNQAIDRVM